MKPSPTKNKREGTRPSPTKKYGRIKNIPHNKINWRA
jgi:hypothetical protein